MNKAKTYFTPELIILFLLGFSSGLPLALTASTLTTWLADSTITISTIGIFAAVATPYSLKFLWAPFIDRLMPPYPFAKLGRRRGWIMLTQLGLLCSLLLLASLNPIHDIQLIALMAVVVAFCSASQDIVIDAYRVEAVTPDQQPKAVVMAQSGYRLGMIVSSAGALYLASYFSWHVTYTIMALLFIVCIITTLCAKEPFYLPAAQAKVQLLHHFVIAPFRDFTRHNGWWLILLFVIVYKLADSFIGTLTNPFLIGLGFSKIDIARILKLYGVIATLSGVFIGSLLVERYGAVKIMVIAGLLHAITNLLYVVQAKVGADALLLTLSVMVENVTGGISSAAFVVYLSGLCSREFTATQYALLSSLSAFGRTWLATPAGYVVTLLGWQLFFLFSALLALPGLVLLYFVQKRVK